MAAVRVIVVDITRLLLRRLRQRRPTGVDRVGLAYVEHFGPRALALVRVGRRWMFFAPDESQQLFAALTHRGDTPTGRGDAHADGAAKLVAAARRLVLTRVLWPRGCARPPRGALLINATHSGLERPDYAVQLRAHALRGLFVVHDLIPITHPQFCRAGEGERHLRRLDTVLRHGDAVVVNSTDTLHALQAHARGRGLVLPPCTVAGLGTVPGIARAAAQPEAPASDARTAHRPQRPSRAHLVVLGTIEPRKNHALLRTVWRELVARLGTAAPELIVIGQPGWMCDELQTWLERSDPAVTHVRYLPDCDDAELAAWLGSARALLLPSWAEGYGLPLAEAIAAGVPVLASDLPVFREIAGAAPWYLPPGGASAWLAAVEELAAPASAARTALAARVRDVHPPSWSAHFERVEALLECSDVRAA